MTPHVRRIQARQMVRLLSRTGAALLGFASLACGGEDEERRCVEYRFASASGARNVEGFYWANYSVLGSQHTGAFRIPPLTGSRTCSVNPNDTSVQEWSMIAWLVPEGLLTSEGTLTRPGCERGGGEACQPRPEDPKVEMTFNLAMGENIVNVVLP